MIVLYMNVYPESKILYQADVLGSFLEPMSMWEYHIGSDQAVDFAIGFSDLLLIQKEMLNSTVE